MNKKLIFILASLVTAGSAFATDAKFSPFQDNLHVQFKKFPENTVLSFVYLANNGLEISGPSSVTASDSPAIKIYSDNKVESGYPSVTMRYPTKLFGTQICTLTLADGPYVPRLGYKTAAPLCLGITVGNIVYTPDEGLNAYALVVSDTE